MKNKIALSLTAGLMFSGCVFETSSQVAHADASVWMVAGNVASSMLYLSLSDGYYYDEYYNRMPYGYVPPSYVRIERIDDMRRYRRHHPHRRVYRVDAPPPPPHVRRYGYRPAPPPHRYHRHYYHGQRPPSGSSMAYPRPSMPNHAARNQFRSAPPHYR